MAIFVKGRGGGPSTLGTADGVENYAPLGDIDRRVFKEVVKQNLDNVFISDTECQRGNLRH